MEKDWDRYKSIVNGRHMRDMQHKISSEYQAHLHQQQWVREQAELVRERQAENQIIPHPLSTFYSSRSYSKPWQNGMTTKTQILGETGHGSGHNREWQYSNTVSKLPAIKKDKKPMRMKTASSTRIIHQPQTSITVSQPSIAVEKKRVHVRQLSAKLGGTYGVETSGRSYVLQRQLKPKKPKGLFDQQRRVFQKKETTPRNDNSMSTTNHDRILTPVSATTHEIRKQTQCNSRPASSRISPLQIGEDVFSGQPVRNIIDATEGDAGVNTVDDVYEVSNNARQLPLIVRTLSYNVPANQPPTVETNFTNSYEDQVHDSENEEHPSSHRQVQEVNTDSLGSTLSGLDTTTRNNSSFGRPNPAPLLASPTLPQIHGINDNNISARSQEYYTVPQTAFRALVGRESAIPSSESSVPYVAPLRLSLSSTAPSITILRENLDLVFHTLSMQRQSARRNMENIESTAQNKESAKQTDPEKLRKLQESLLEEDSEEEGDLCRICLMGVETRENHLIAPCQCSGSLEYVHTECMKKWLMAKIKSGAELSSVRTCEMCKQKVECDIEGFNLDEQYRKHQQTKATLNPSLYLVLLLHLYQQRYEELLRLSNTRERVSEISRQFSHLSSGSNEDSRDNDQDF